MLGANLLRDHNVVFDYDNHLVGFADGACDYHADSKESDGGGAAAEVCKSIGCCLCVFSCCFVSFRFVSYGCLRFVVMAQTAERNIFSPCASH